MPSPAAIAEPTPMLDLVDALYAVAMASSAELEFATRALEPYDLNRLALAFSMLDNDR